MMMFFFLMTMLSIILTFYQLFQMIALLGGDGNQLVLQSPTLILPYQFKGECKRTHTSAV